ncbi:hypothetical protein DFA_03455 [Cavenderia fasciculata]|uniref:Uncharacterized protein n=1 Tax=Cavenderia fasciculata TaxID=261658 RepID=F4PHM3_CACFS|nr:uncharacterized protein DFA_03455 [Cavenderia fasciculata]EGG25207.1 hypothetical protein DFA_03455 [Cavenderia fasciculata]|eukprot:XP_004363058.1 hypothetical protein DFA_03455 [Cavenderia fasciculata]
MNNNDDDDATCSIVGLPDIVILNIISYIDNNVDVICLMLTSTKNTIKTDHHNANGLQCGGRRRRPLPTLLRLFKDVRTLPDATQFPNNQQMKVFQEIYEASLSQSSRNKKKKLVIKRQNLSSIKIDDQHIEKIKISKCSGVIDKDNFPPSVVQMEVNVVHIEKSTNERFWSAQSQPFRLVDRSMHVFNEYLKN